MYLPVCNLIHVIAFILDDGIQEMPEPSFSSRNCNNGLTRLWQLKIFWGISWIPMTCEL